MGWTPLVDNISVNVKKYVSHSSTRLRYSWSTFEKALGGTIPTIMSRWIGGSHVEILDSAGDAYNTDARRTESHFLPSSPFHSLSRRLQERFIENNNTNLDRLFGCLFTSKSDLLP